MRVGLFVTCVNDTLYPETGRAVVTVLERLGVAVGFPASQSCCGQPHFNTGYRHQAEPLLRRTVDAFRDYAYVVTPSGSCAAMVRENYPRMAAKAADEGRGQGLSQAAADLVAKTYELTEFLVDVLGVTDVGAYYPHTVTYHPTCHGLRSLGLGDRPRRLLSAVRGLTLVELPGAEECCGFGGTFAVKNPDVSAAMGADKARQIIGTRAETVCTVDNSCGMHIGGTLSRLGSPVRPVHLAEILAGTDPASDPDTGTGTGTGTGMDTRHGTEGAGR